MDDLHVIAICVLASTVLTGFCLVIGCCASCMYAKNTPCSV
ncbi:putative P6 protein [Barley yellow dwarf virus OYV]|nr:putative P6 protein [Barley yellow dwarf virus OYV]QCO93394.1 putative P6 protein [Barley yellow dwarf virus OYV]QCO93401.1 putative P6 protein [Barley yellow dwarf virus OYV]QCO93408.1 putative P6 protein [Barley yellow dwarf virus OYV]